MKKEGLKFNKDNYRIWRDRMNISIKSLGSQYWDHIGTNYITPIGILTNDQKKEQQENHQELEAIINSSSDVWYLFFDNTPLVVIDIAPSGKATNVKEVEMDKVKSTESTPTGKTDSPTRVLAIDTSQVEKKSVSELSPIEIMMMATQKLLKQGTIDKGLIN